MALWPTFLEVRRASEVAVEGVDVCRVRPDLVQGRLEACLAIAHRVFPDHAVDRRAVAHVRGRQGVVRNLCPRDGRGSDPPGGQGAGRDLPGVQVVDVGVGDMQRAVLDGGPDRRGCGAGVQVDDEHLAGDRLPRVGVE